MPNLSEILSKAYTYTKNHKFLWFFGVFLTGWGVLNFVRHVDFDPATQLQNLMQIAEVAKGRPGFLFLSVVGALLVLVGMSILGAVARAMIIDTALHSERKNEVSLKLAIKRTDKKHWRVFWVGVFTSATMLFILSWLAVPLYFVFKGGADMRAVLLVLLAFAIFVPIIVILSLVNIFSACYIVVYDLKAIQAIRGSFDLLAGFWEKTVGLFVFLLLLYTILILFSATITGLGSLVVYNLFMFVQALPATIIFGILVVVTSLLMILVNSVLNVFTNFAWTLFFLKIVKVKFIEEGAVIAQSLIG